VFAHDVGKALNDLGTISQSFRSLMSLMPPSEEFHIVTFATRLTCQFTLLFCCLLISVSLCRAADNALTPEEKAAGWILLFDGKTLDGWMTSSEKPSAKPVEESSLNPHGCGGYMLVHKKMWENYVLALDFKISKGCNSGIFVRTFSLKPREGRDVGFNGLEIAIDDTKGADYHDTGALYDLSKPTRNTMKPAGEWNHIEITSKDSIIEITLNGEQVNRVNLDEFTQPFRRPDGSEHKFDIAFKDHPHKGYIGLQDHGGNCWFKNIKIKVLEPSAK
jgi:hypothetical protein